ncbi:MAG TPA: ABC transporter permease [Patescibacteria group bacterium]|nr:ABC transporter permease [Patescibacteria group bacterium]
MASLLQDLRYSIRQCRNNPGLTAAVVLVLALGVAANAVTFTVLKATLLRPLPFRQPNRLVQLWSTRTHGVFTRMEFSTPDYLDYREHNQVFEALGGYSAVGATYLGPGGAEQVQAALSSANLFDVLGVTPAIGRTFQAGEDEPNGPPVAMLTWEGWQRRFGGDPHIIGKTAILNDAPREIVGVLPRNFQFSTSYGAEFWIPLRMQGWRARRNARWFHPVGRLKPGVTIAQAQASLDVLSAHLREQYPNDDGGVGVQVVDLREQFVGNVRPVLLLLMSAVGCFLLITCGNLAGLLLSRAVSRQKEMSIRVSLGASRRRILQQLLTESGLLSLLGGLAGVVLSIWLLPAALHSIPKEEMLLMPAWSDLHVDWGFLLVALAIALATGIVFGLAPALLAFRPDLRNALADATRGSSAGVERHRLRNVLVVAEIALAIVLLYGGGLMLKSLALVMRTDPGFRTDDLLTLQVDLPGRKYPKDADAIAFQHRMLGAFAELPGVRGVATTSTLPLTGGNNTSLFVREGRRTPGETESHEANSREVSPDYFRVMGVPLRSGRLFNEHDDALSPHVVIINQTLADRVFPGEDPVGQRIDFTYTNTPNLWLIVGVVGDENMTALDAAPNPVAYTPFDQSADSYMNVVLRTSQSPESLGPSAERIIRQMDPTIPVFAVESMQSIIAESPSIFMRRSPAYLIAGFGAVGLLLAAVGLYSLLAYAVAQRRRELGIRMALGAQKRDVLSLIVGGGLRLAIAGVVLGIACALGVSHLLGSFLYRVSPGDPLTIAAVCALLVFVALAATGQPAWRAAAIDPIESLREE